MKKMDFTTVAIVWFAKSFWILELWLLVLVDRASFLVFCFLGSCCFCCLQRGLFVRAFRNGYLDGGDCAVDASVGCLFRVSRFCASLHLLPIAASFISGICRCRFGVSGCQLHGFVREDVGGEFSLVVIYGFLSLPAHAPWLRHSAALEEQGTRVYRDQERLVCWRMAMVTSRCTAREPCCCGLHLWASAKLFCATFAIPMYTYLGHKGSSAVGYRACRSVGREETVSESSCLRTLCLR